MLLTSDSSIRRLNRTYRGKDQTTDVLAFPSAMDLEPGRQHLGEIAISLPRAQRQARRAGWRLRDELALLVTHGYLHLLGYDHETDDGAMRRMEERLLLQAAHLSIDSRHLPWGETPAARTTAARAPRSRRPGRKS